MAIHRRFIKTEEGIEVITPPRVGPLRRLPTASEVMRTGVRSEQRCWKHLIHFLVTQITKRKERAILKDVNKLHKLVSTRVAL